MGLCNGFLECVDLIAVAMLQVADLLSEDDHEVAVTGAR